MILASKGKLWLQVSDDWWVGGLGLWIGYSGFAIMLGPFLVSWDANEQEELRA